MNSRRGQQDGDEPAAALYDVMALQSGPSPPVGGEGEGPRVDSAAEGEVGSAVNRVVGPLTLPSPPAGGRRGLKSWLLDETKLIPAQNPIS